MFWRVVGIRKFGRGRKKWREKETRGKKFKGKTKEKVKRSWNNQFTTREGVFTFNIMVFEKSRSSTKKNGERN
jgi:hypothetical protein